jgi:rRNA maturation endonuclease Nob1
MNWRFSAIEYFVVLAIIGLLVVNFTYWRPRALARRKLARCPECYAYHSRSAESCPHCGRPIPLRAWRKDDPDNPYQSP